MFNPELVEELLGDDASPPTKVRACQAFRELIRLVSVGSREHAWGELRLGLIFENGQIKELKTSEQRTIRTGG